MSIERFKTVADMPRPPLVTGDRLVSAMAAVWARAHLDAPAEIPHGVYKYRSLDEAQKARHRFTRERLARRHSR